MSDNKTSDNKRYFRCSSELWKDFDETVKEDNLYKDKSDCLRDLIRNYIKMNKKSNL